MQAVIGLRDERATPLFAYILRHVSHRGPLAEVYLRAIESLGTLRDPDAIPPLKEALYRGEWWAPRRNDRPAIGRGRGARAHRHARRATPCSRKRPRAARAASARRRGRT